MSESRYQLLFTELARQGRGAFVPFAVIGDPTPGASLEIIEELVRAGADALELGIPFSDPIADGPTIQSATARALAAGTTAEACFEVIAAVRAAHRSLPIGLLVYANLVAAPGVQDFYERAARAGVDSVLVADLPLFEAAPFAYAAIAAGIDPVLIAPPNANGERLAGIARTTRGYTYVVARSGVTGARERLRLDRAELIDRLAELGAPPALVGFGISRPEHVSAVLDAGAAGAISGSAVVSIVERNLHRSARMLREIAEFTAAMKQAARTRRTR